MIFPYWETVRGGEVRLFPLIQVRVHNGEKSILLDALVDSGAEQNVLSLEVADALDISLDQAEPVIVVGAAGHELEGYRTTLELQLGRYRWSAPTIFSEAGRRRGLLGQTGFFAYFTVTFRYDTGQMGYNGFT